MLPEGTITIRVGNGIYPTNGEDSYIHTSQLGDRYLAKGGGKGADAQTGGIDGGCGSGAGVQVSGSTPYDGGSAVSTNIVNGTTSVGPSDTSSYVVYGNRGGHQRDTNGTSPDGNYSYPGGGGGIGSAGQDNIESNANAGNGGSGRNSAVISGTTYNFQSYFNNGNTFGFNGYIGGGGGGNNGSGLNSGAHGLTGDTSYSQIAPVNTGSGGGPFRIGSSGIVIIRYQYLTMSLLSSSIELIRGTTGDANRDFKIGNYNGDFIVKSSLNGSDSDYIKMSGTNGAIYNFTNSLYWTQTSDRRIKENIQRASYDKCYENIDKLELNRFNYIKEFNTGNKDTNQLGFIAQEIKDIFPKAVFSNSYNSDDLNVHDLLSIDIGQINYTLYGAVKKLMEINKDKENRLKRLENLLNIMCDTSNIQIDTSNIQIDTSNIQIDTSNIQIDTCNIHIDTSNIQIDTSNIDIPYFS